MLVAITGGSGSGKSTVAMALRDALPDGQAVLVSEDWYYMDCSLFPDFDAATFDFDDIVIRDHALLREHLQALKAGQPVTAPDYCFVNHARKQTGRPVRPAPVVIVEGSHLLCAPQVAAVFDLKVYLDTPDDVRFIRRLLRDQVERGRSQESVVRQYLKTVRPAHQRFTEKSRAVADIVLQDLSAAVERPGAEEVRAFIQPLLEHPVLAGVRAQRSAAQG